MKTKTVIALASLFVLSACIEKIESPKQVAQKYWAAVIANDTATAKQLVSKDTQQSFENYLALSPEHKSTIGTVDLNDEKAIVATVIQPEGEIPVDKRQFETVLILEDGHWKIDASRTEPPPPKTEAQQELEELSENLEKSINKNIDTVDEAFKEGVETLNEALREGSHEMSESFLKGLKQLNEALRESVDKMKERRKQSTPVDESTGEGAI